MTRKPSLPIGFLALLCLLAYVAQAQEPASGETGENQVIQSFYLENAHIKGVMTMVRSLVGVKSVAADENLNAVILRDTAANVKLAEQIIRAHDRPPNEVLVDVKLIEFEGRKLHELSGADGAVPVRLAAGELRRIETAAAARVLAHPKLSVVAGKKVELMIGDRVPITTDAQGTVSYQDVGFRLKVTPQVHAAAAEVTLDFEMELSQVPRGAGRPVVETRWISSSVRLGDGETYLLSGLSHGGTDSAAGTAEKGPTEIGLALTPRIIRRLDVREARGPIPVGTGSP